jgi:hypothetical protein
MQDMNNTLARTTITLPQTLLRTAKIIAVHQNKALSLIISEALEEKLMPNKRNLPKRNPMMLLGKYSLGIKSRLRRKDLYAEHIKHKMSY